MGILHSYKKKVKEHTLRFEPTMYTNTYGSVVITTYINNKIYKSSTEEEMDIKRINKIWKNLKRHPEKVDFWIDDKDFIDKTLSLFNIKRPEKLDIAMVQSSYNILFMPYFDGQLFPLREDGAFPLTASKGKIYPINFTNNIESDATKSSQNIDLEKK